MNVDDMTEEAVRWYLKMLVSGLDALDKDDFFGTEGWRYFMLGED